MKKRGTPLGFLAGDIAPNSHCIYTYSRRDETLVRNIAEFLLAGLQVGEASVCLADEETCAHVTGRLAEMGATSDAGDGLIVRAVRGSRADRGIQDAGSITASLRDIAAMCREGNRTRVFTDFGNLHRGRTAGFKLLEHEALLSLDCPMTIAMCGYQTSPVGRGRLTQVRKAHPFIADYQSIRRNPYYVDPVRLLAGLYSYRRVSREYLAVMGEARALRTDIEEIAARTPLSVPGITGLQEVTGRIFNHLIARSRPVSDGPSPHFHVVLAAESDRFLVTLRMHGVELSDECPHVPNLRAHMRSCPCLEEGLLDDMDVESWRGETVITLLKRHDPPHRPSR